jgi:hypothetical protein
MLLGTKSDNLHSGGSRYDMAIPASLNLCPAVDIAHKPR